jgi:ferric-dicitrate binding protein FerR (iron transport regulator)
MDMAALTAKDRHSQRRAMMLVALCFAAAGAILAAALLWPDGLIEQVSFAAVPR